MWGYLYRGWRFHRFQGMVLGVRNCTIPWVCENGDYLFRSAFVTLSAIQLNIIIYLFQITKLHHITQIISFLGPLGSPLPSRSPFWKPKCKVRSTVLVPTVPRTFPRACTKSNLFYFLPSVLFASLPVHPLPATKSLGFYFEKRDSAACQF